MNWVEQWKNNFIFNNLHLYAIECTSIKRIMISTLTDLHKEEILSYYWNRNWMNFINVIHSSERNNSQGFSKPKQNKLLLKDQKRVRDSYMNNLEIRKTKLRLWLVCSSIFFIGKVNFTSDFICDRMIAQTLNKVSICRDLAPRTCQI